MSILKSRLTKLASLVRQGSFQDAINLAVKLHERYPKDQSVLLLQAEALLAIGRFDEAAEISAGVSGLARPQLLKARMISAEGFRRASRHAEALDALSEAVSIDWENLALHANLCALALHQGAFESAQASAEFLLAHSVDAEMLHNAGHVFWALADEERAFRCFEASFKKKPEKVSNWAPLLSFAMRHCEWSLVDDLRYRIAGSYEKGEFEKINEVPLSNISWCRNELWNLEVAKRFSRRFSGIVSMSPQDSSFRRRKIRIGYMSSDFYDHATLHLFVGVLESHDRENFDILAYDYSAFRVDSEYRVRFEAAAEVHDIGDLSDSAAAQLVRSHEVDILVDLKGLTQGSRLGIMAYRPAKVHVTYLGYPGTSGCSFVDYVIADPIVVPDESLRFYSESVCRLPVTYQCNDHRRLVPENVLDRNSLGLPDKATVLCCFNQAYKIEKEIFDVWVEVLDKFPETILWLLDPGELAAKNLRGRMDELGVDPARLVLADKVSSREHLSRVGSADLALDTRTYTGHTTTSDMLWCGVPVVALRGEHFASRVSESLLGACGLGSLVAENLHEYRLMIEDLVSDRAHLAAIRKNLVANRLDHALFDTVTFVRHLERAYRSMLTCVDSSECPTALDVS